MVTGLVAVLASNCSAESLTIFFAPSTPLL
jgi:hypothetical protein